MKRLILTTIAITLTLGIGLLVGYGYAANQCVRQQQSQSYTGLIMELRSKEIPMMNDLIKVITQVQTRDEGGLLKVKKVRYLTGTIENQALATSIKDVKIRIDYLSETESVISSQEITIYKIITPGFKKDFKEKITVPEKTKNWQSSIVDLRTD